MANNYSPIKNGYVFYGAEFSLYSGKVRAYLRKKGLPFEERLSDLSAYKNFIVPRTGVRFIPVVQTPDDTVLQDTTVIIDYLEQQHPEKSVYPGGVKQKLAALLLEVYGDEWLLIPAMHYRWNYPDTNLPFIYQEFGKTIFPSWPKFIQTFLGKKIGNKFRGFLPLLGITEQTTTAIELSYTRLLADLDRHFTDHDFLFGQRPSIGDYGLIAPLYAHLYRDPFPGKIMRETAPRVAAWVERMISTEVASGDFIASDQVASTLEPVLARMAREQIPVLLDTAEKLSDWRDDNPDSEIPRTIGNHRFSIEGASEERAMIPYSLWMWQRPVDFYQSLSAENKAEIDPWLDKIGLLAALNTPITERLQRQHNKLKFA